MADFVAVLKKTIGNLGETTPEIREKVYQKARATIGAKLAAMNPPPPEAIAERQRQQLENAIREIEREFQAKAPAEPSDPLAELDALFADLSKPKPDKAKSEPAAAVTPAAPIASPRPGGVKPVAEGAPATPPASPPASSSVQGPEVDVDFQTADNADQQPLADPEFAPEDVPPPPADRGARPSFGRWIAAAAVVILVGGAAYAMWLNKDGFAGLFGEGQTEIAAQDAGEEAVSEPVAETQEPQPEAEPEEEAATAPDPVAPAETAAEEPQKFTQRLNTDGSEIDEGPAGGETSIGEGTSMAAATQPEGEPLPGTGEAAAEAGDNGGEAGIPVAQKAIFYEERTAVAEGTADSGTVVWSLAQESPGNDLPPEPAIRAEAIIPDKDLKLRLTIRRNADQTLPASHIVELIFLTPENFASGPIDNVLRMTMKETEQAAGNPLRGIPAKIADGFFLVALNDADTEVVQNMRMLRDQNWIDLPIVYKSGRRALVTMEKGLPGEKIFEEALKAWEAASSG